MERDQKFLLNVTNLSNFIQPRKDNVNRSNISTKQLTFHLISQLPEEIFNELLEIYRIDFEIFGYDVPKFNLQQHNIEMGTQSIKSHFVI